MLRQRCGTKPVQSLGDDLVEMEPAVPEEEKEEAASGGGGGGGGGLIATMLVPDPKLVPKEYWAFRGLTTLLGLISTAKGALTAQALMIAIGVGDADATPLDYLVIAEINAAIGRFAGLALASWVSSSYFAMHAKRTMVLNATVGKLGSVFAVLLLLYPGQLQAITLAESLFNVLMSLMVSPANAALWEHMQLSPDPAKRAMVGQINGNQDRLRTFLHMALRYYAVFIIFAEPPEDFTYVWVGVLVGGLLEAVVEIWRVLIAAPLTFNRATFHTACRIWTEPGGGADAVAGIENPENWKATLEDLAEYFERGEAFPELQPRSVARSETIVPRPGGGDRWSRLGLGVSLERLLPVSAQLPPWAAASLINRLLTVHRDERYVLGADAASRTLQVVLKEGATPADQLKAAFHAHYAEQRLAAAEDLHDAGQTDYRTRSAAGSPLDLSRIVACLSDAYPEANKSWPKFLAVLERLGWKSTACVMHPGEWRLQPEPLPQHPTLRRNGSKQKTKTKKKGREFDDDQPRRLTQCKPNPGGEPDAQTFWLQREHLALPSAYAASGGGGNGARGRDRSPSPSPSYRGGLVLEQPQPQTAAEKAAEASGEASSSGVEPLYSILLPRGFPDSVAPEYMHYQLWDTLQVMMADLRSILISNAGLIGQGVGVEGATPLGTMWVDFRVEFFSTCQGLLVGGFADAGASASSMKRWRVYKTLLSYFDTTCTLLQGMYPRHRIHARLVQTGVANLVNPFAGGADQALVLHLSNGSQDPAFRADVAAKESNQDRALGLLLMAIRFGLLLWVGTNWERAWFVVAALSVGHIGLNYMAARILVLKTLNHSRFQLVFEAWCDGREEEQPKGGEKLEPLAPEAIAEEESVLPKLLSAPWSVFDVGVSAQQLLPSPADAMLVGALVRAHAKEGYILGGHPAKEWLCAVLKEDRSEDVNSTQFRAAMHAGFVRRQLRQQTEPVTARWLVEVIVRSHARMEAAVEEFEASLVASGWRRYATGGCPQLQFNPGKWRLLVDKTD